MAYKKKVVEPEEVQQDEAATQLKEQADALAAIVIAVVRKTGGKVTLRRDDLEKALLDMRSGHGMIVKKDPDGEGWVKITIEYREE
jgi:hypothetical protein